MQAAYARLTNRQKGALRAHRIAHPELIHKQLAEWAVVAFQLPHAPSRMTIRRVLRAQNDAALNPMHKTNRAVLYPLLEEEVLQWIRSCEEWRIPIVTGATIREKADAIRERMLVAASPPTAEVLSSLLFSNGWLCSFWKRHRLTSKRIHGEAASVKTASIEGGRVVLRDATNGYARRGVCNMDETAYFYCTAPSKTISAKHFSSRKNLKKRMTVVVACNADDSSKLSLLFVEGSRQPRCFGGKSPTELNVEYVSSRKGWMNSELFQCWAKRFNDKMRAESRHVLLLLDNVFSHRLKVSLSNVTLHMLPPNTTSYLQPQDAGIIRQFKEKISKLQNRHVLNRFDDLLQRMSDIGKENMEREIEALRHVDVLEVMRWARNVWEMVSKTAITNCWCHTGILDNDIYELVERVDNIRLVPPTPRQPLN